MVNVKFLMMILKKKIMNEKISINNIMSSNELVIPDFKFKNNLEKHSVVFGLIAQVSDHIKKIPNFEKLRVELELIKLVCRIVENIVNSKTIYP